MTQPPPTGAPDPSQEPGYQPPAQPGYPEPGYAQPGSAQPGYIPPAGYLPPAPAAPPAGFSSSEEKTWALVATFGAAIGTFISCGVLAALGPLIAYLAKGKEPGVRRFALPALNFFLPITGIALIAVVLRAFAGAAFDGAFGTLLYLLFSLVLLAVWIVGIVFGILAGVKANQGVDYKYPFSLNLIK
jgi:uncharacterized Tic20 family protein